MTREENMAKMAAIRSEVEALVTEYNELIAKEEYKAARTTEKSIEDKVKEYNGTSRLVCFDDLKSNDNPMLEAVKILYYKGIRVRDQEVEDESIIFPPRIVEESNRSIDLLKLHNHCKGIGADKNWLYMVQKVNFLLTAKQAKALGLDIKAINDSYAMNQIARDMDLGKNPTGATQMLATMQKVVDAMLGTGYKVTAKEVDYLNAIYAKKGRKPLTVVCANHRYLVSYFMEICHKVVTGAGYTLESKEIKTDKPAPATPAAKEPVPATIATPVAAE